MLLRLLTTTDLGLKLTALFGMGALTTATVVSDATGAITPWQHITTPTALYAIALFIFHLGMTWQTFMDHKRRLALLENWRDVRALEVFASQEVAKDLADRLARIERVCDTRHL